MAEKLTNKSTHVSSIARFSFERCDIIKSLFEQRCIEEELPFETLEDDSLRVIDGDMEVRFTACGQDCAFHIVAARQLDLIEICSTITEGLAQIDPSLSKLSWSHAADALDSPDCLTLATIIERESIGCSWWRLVLEVSPVEITKFLGAHWHVQVLRPGRPGRDPVWPVVNAHGLVEWPTGQNELSRRVFTIRSVDQSRNTISLDIYRHDRGSSCRWAETVPIGDVVGLWGPSGRRGPEGHSILVGGDETAVPAILRALGTLPPTTTGRAVLMVGDEEDIQPNPSNQIAIEWLFRARGDDLVAVFCETPMPAPDANLWFAASQEQARAVREHARGDRALERSQIKALTYWN